MTGPGARRRPDVPLRLWLPLALLVVAVVVATARQIADSLGWPSWADTLVSSGSFGLFFLVASPRITRAQQARRERRRTRTSRQV